MATWTTLLLFCVQSCLFVNLCRGAVQCVCTTADCKRDGKARCNATNMCYVQYMPVNPALDPGGSAIVRGCIDEYTPLLCENRRPQAFTGSWPVLHCCKEDWCNKDVLPTIPPWLTSIDNTEHKEEEIDPKDLVAPPKQPENEEAIFIKQLDKDNYVDQTDSQEYPVNGRQHHDFHSRTKTINPLYIAVPVAGACVLLAIIIFAIYVLKRQNQYYEEYRYHSNLRHHPPHTDCVLQDPNCPKKSLYSECERSSSGSETKLLMKV